MTQKEYNALTYEQKKYIVSPYSITDCSRQTSYSRYSFDYRGNGGPLSIVEIEIPKGIEIIHEGCFSNCISLSELKIPSTIEVIDEAAFRECISLRKFDWPEKLREIGHNAFYNCAFNDMVIPQSVNKIGSYVFSKELDSIRIPDYLEYCCPYAFNNEKETLEVIFKNQNYKLIDDWVINLKNKTLLFSTSTKKKAIIPDVAENLPYAFHDNHYVEEIFFPLSVIEKYSDSIWDTIFYNFWPRTKKIQVSSYFSEKVSDSYEIYKKKHADFSNSRVLIEYVVNNR